MNRVLLEVPGLEGQDATERVIGALRAVKGVTAVSQQQPGELEVSYDDAAATIVDLIRAVRGQGFRAGML